MGYQFLNYLEGTPGSGKTTLLIEIAAAADACGERAVIILPSMESVDMFERYKHRSSSIKVVSAYEVRRTKFRGLVPDIIIIDYAASCAVDIVSDVVDIVSNRNITPKLVVVR